VRSLLLHGVAAAGRALASGEARATDLVRASLDAIAAEDHRLASVVATAPGSSLADAEASDARRRAGRPLSRIDGVPIAVKDIIATAGMPTRAGSAAQDPRAFGDRDAALIRRLRAHGGIVVAKTSTMEYAMGVPEDRPDAPAPRNPWHTDHWTGGSSSGSASGVAAGLFPGAIGTDTAGSIRLPSAWCGVTGLKPTFGRVTLDGVIPLGATFDHAGPTARTAEDCLWLLAAIADDAIGLERCIQARSADSLAGTRIGVVRDLVDECVPETRAAIADALTILSGLGATLVEVSLPHVSAAHAATIVGLTAEAYEYHRDALAQRWSSYGADARQTLASGAIVTAAEYVHLQRLRAMIRDDADRVLTGLDLVVGPVATTAAPALATIDYDELVATFRTTYWNATGHPAASVPVGFTEAGLPIGMQVAAARGADGRLLSLVSAFQDVTDHHLAVPATVAA
jgi:aspartyl-tRNA(Asn)/glutamyl-tRNA(Gln) amidotransferase subunit A